jgi:hypothetical protein
MNADSKKNPAPIAPTSAEPSNAAGSKPRVAPVEKGTLVKKGHSKTVDPYKQAKPSRKNVLGQGAKGTGARYGVRVKFQQTTAPEAGATQGNGRIFSPAVRRQKPNFTAGSADLD